MAFYRFWIDSPLSVEDFLSGLRPLVAENEGQRPPIRLNLGSPVTEGVRPFVGCVDWDSFMIRTYIKSRDSFAPFIVGKSVACKTGSRWKVSMFMYPVSTVFAGIFCGAFASGVYVEWQRHGLAFTTIAAAVITVLVSCALFGAFFWKAADARRLLEQAAGALPS